MQNEQKGGISCFPGYSLRLSLGVESVGDTRIASRDTNAARPLSNPYRNYIKPPDIFRKLQRVFRKALENPP